MTRASRGNFADIDEKQICEEVEGGGGAQDRERITKRS